MCQDDIRIRRECLDNLDQLQVDLVIPDLRKRFDCPGLTDKLMKATKISRVCFEGKYEIFGLRVTVGESFKIEEGQSLQFRIIKPGPHDVEMGKCTWTPTEGKKSMFLEGREIGEWMMIPFQLEPSIVIEMRMLKEKKKKVEVSVERDGKIEKGWKWENVFEEVNGVAKKALEMDGPALNWQWTVFGPGKKFAHKELQKPSQVGAKTVAAAPSEESASKPAPKSTAQAAPAQKSAARSKQPAPKPPKPTQRPSNASRGTKRRRDDAEDENPVPQIDRQNRAGPPAPKRNKPKLETVTTERQVQEQIQGPARKKKSRTILAWYEGRYADKPPPRERKIPVPGFRGDAVRGDYGFPDEQIAPLGERTHSAWNRRAWDRIGGF